MERPTWVGQLLGESKCEQCFADWIMATGVGLQGSQRPDFEAERVEEMTDGDVSHSSDFKMRTFRTVALLDLFAFSWGFFLLSFQIIFCV
jgi:hypothetical protein